MMKQAGGKMLDENAQLVIDSPENLRALEYLNDLVNTYKVVPPSAVTWDHADPINALGIGKVAMCTTGVASDYTPGYVPGHIYAYRRYSATHRTRWHVW
jgi:ABC-type glycerol-3-phosphate transport system substrate-binding protein